MRILFLHDNFPAQFGRLGQYLAGEGWDVTFGTQREGAAAKGLKTFNYKPHREVTEKIHPYAVNFEKAVLNGQGLARAAIALRDKGYRPDIVMAHSGWGPGLFVKDVWPRAAYVGYFEWFYRREAPDVAFLDNGPRQIDDLLRGRARNAAILTDLFSCDTGIVPTAFQKNQFPDIFDGKLSVIHDGVDTETYKPRDGAKLVIGDLDLTEASEIVTYVARGMEPYRGFPQFMAAVSKLMARRPQTHVVIAGEDRVAYGKKLPEGESFKKQALAEHAFDESRLHFTGLVSRPDYLTLLQASSVHVYLTVPFVLSWSMMEAMSAGCALLVSDTAPVRELLDEKSAVFTDFHDTEEIAAKLEALLDDAPRRRAMGETARARIVKGYAMKDIFPRKKTMLEGLIARGN